MFIEAGQHDCKAGRAASAACSIPRDRPDLLMLPPSVERILLGGFAAMADHRITISPTMPCSAWVLPSLSLTPQCRSVIRPVATGTSHHSAV